jgi:phage terminase large subunit-like protein
VRRAYTQFKQAVDGQQTTHAADPRFAQHLTNVVVSLDGYGLKITKDSPESDRHIDLAVAAAGAYDLAVRNGAAGSIYDTRGLLQVG